MINLSLESRMKIKEVTSIATNRRNFLKGAGLTGAGLLTATALGRQFGSNVQRVEAATYSDADVLNFALNLEYLEAEFYLMSTYGTTLVGLGVISKEDETGPTTGGGMVPLVAVKGAFVHLIAFDDHRTGFANLADEARPGGAPPDPFHPTATFRVTLADPGRYVLWSWFLLGGREVAVPFGLHVLP